MSSSSANVTTRTVEESLDSSGMPMVSDHNTAVQLALIESQAEASKTEDAVQVDEKIKSDIPAPYGNDRRRSELLNSRSAQEVIESILRRNDRTDEEALLLYEQIKDFKFFNQVLKDKNEPESILTVIKNFKYKKVKAGRTVFVEGDPSSRNVFVVFSGEFLVMVQKLDHITEANIAAAKDNNDTSTPRFELPSIPVLITQTSASSEDSVVDLEDGVQESPKDVVKEEAKSNTRLSISPKMSRFKKRQDTRKLELNIQEKIVGDAENEAKILRQSSVPGSKEARNSANNTPVLHKESTLKKLKVRKAKNDYFDRRYGYVKDRISRGGYFGEVAIEEGSKRSATILAVTDCELLILSASVFNSLKNEHDRKVRRILDIITAKLPSLSQVKARNVIKNYFYMFEEKEFYYGNHIINEGEKSDFLYIIYEGICEIYRTVRIQEDDALPAFYSKIKSAFFSQTYSVKEKIPLTILQDGSMVGEELLFSEDDPTYSYSIQVASDTCKAIRVNKDIFALRFPKEVLEDIRQAYEEKKTYKNNLLRQNLEKRDINSLKGDIDDRFLVVLRDVQQDFGAKSPKINKNPSPYISYKMMMEDNIQNDDAVVSPNSSISLPRISKGRSQSPVAMAESEAKRKLIPFSRTNLMPAINEREKEKKSSIGNLDLTKQISIIKPKRIKNTGGKSFTDEISDKKHFVDHIRKSDGAGKFQDMGDVYDSLGDKLNLNPHFNIIKANVNNVDYYKLDFGKSYDFLERSLYLEKNRGKPKNSNDQSITEQLSRYDESKSHKKSSSVCHDDSKALSVKQLAKYLKIVDAEKFRSNKKTLLLKLQENFEKDPGSRLDSEILNADSYNSSSMLNRFSHFEPSFLKDFSINSKEIQRSKYNRSFDNMPSYSNIKSPSYSPTNANRSGLDLLVSPTTNDRSLLSHDVDMTELIALKEALTKETNLDLFRRQTLPMKNLNLVSPTSKVKPNRAFVGHMRKF